MNWTTDKIGLKDNQTKTRRIDLNKFTLGQVQGGKFWYVLIGNSYKYNPDCYSAFFYDFFDPQSVEGFLHYIVPFGLS